MKILFVIPYFLPANNYGGPVTVAHLQAKYLVQAGHQVTVATTDTLSSNNRNPIEKEIIDGINVIRFPVRFNFLKRFNYYYSPQFKNWLVENISNFDLIHSHDFYTYQNIVVAKIAPRYNVPFFIQPHGSAVPILDRGRTLVKKLFINLFGHSIIKRANGVIAITKKEKDAIEKYYRCNRVLLVPNGIEEIRDGYLLTDIRRLHKIPISAKIIFSLGRLHPIKGFDHLIKTFYHLNSIRSDIFLIIAGPDEGDLHNLQRLCHNLNISSNVIFTGNVNKSEAVAYFRSSQLFALMSRQEPFPMVILEAVSHHLPLIMSCGIEFSEKLRGQHFAKIVNPNKYRTNAMLIDKVLRTSGYKSFGFDKFLSDYRIESVCRQLEIIYNNAKR